jgi:hypothetical protein
MAEPPQSPRGSERTPPAFGFYFRAAMTENFGRVLHRLAVLIFVICRKKVQDMTKFVQQSKRSSI